MIVSERPPKPVPRLRKTWKRQHSISRKDLWSSTSQGGQNERVRAQVSLIMRTLGLPCPQSEPQAHLRESHVLAARPCFSEGFSPPGSTVVYFLLVSYCEVRHCPFDTLPPQNRPIWLGKDTGVWSRRNDRRPHHPPQDRQPYTRVHRCPRQPWLPSSSKNAVTTRTRTQPGVSPLLLRWPSSMGVCSSSARAMASPSTYPRGQ